MQAGFRRLDGEVKELRVEVNGARDELRGEIKQSSAELRREIKQSNAELRAELTALNAQLAARNRTMIQVAFAMVTAVVAGVLLHLL